MKQLRNHYRNAPDSWQDLEIAVSEPGGTCAAELIDVSGGGMCVAFAADAAPRAELGTVLEVHIMDAVLPVPLHAAAAVVRIENDDGWCVLGLQFLDWMGLVAAVPKHLAGLFNLRLDPRLQMDPAQPVQVVLHDVEGEFEVRGVLLDLSRGGLSLSADLTAQCYLKRVDDVVVEFELPGIDRTFRLASVIRNRCLSGESVRYGIWFDGEASADLELQTNTIGAYVEQRLEWALQHLSQS